ncbi:MAG TPA: ABC transporter ATP-binding protein [Candidatus Caccovivens faecavium]|nr:ABC transporter ATP-binding protein [Candidatus Caccovivens faecavium]
MSRHVMTGEKPVKGQFKKSMVKLIKYCKKFYWLIGISLILGAISVVCQIISPNLISDLTELISGGLMSGGIDLDAVTRTALTILTLALFMAVLGYFQHFIMATATQKIVFKFRDDISWKINKLPLQYFDTHLYGDTLSRVTNDVDTIGQTMNQSVSSLFSNIILFVGVIIAMFVTQWIMAFTVIGATLIGFLIIVICLSKSQKYFIMQQKNLGDLNAHIEEVYSGHNVIKLFNAEKDKGEEFAKINKKLYTSAWKSQFLSNAMMPIMGFVGNFAFVAVCVVGAVLAANGTIGLGPIAAFMIYARMFSNPLSQIAQSLTSLQSTSAACGRVFEFLEEKELENEDKKTEMLTDVKGEIEFDHVKFGYTKDKIIIKDFSVKVYAGEKVAIVGPTGAGKTTLVNLLMRFYEINSGDIRIDGKSIKDLTRENIHDLFGMVLQDTWLFQGTIKENLRYNKENVTDEQIVEACKSVGVDHFIQTLPQGYDTVIDDAVNLSAGQKQLLTIARTMVANNPMLILDEATSSVDTRTEELIQKAMDKLMEGRTSFIIAHRLSTIKNADIILVLKDGDVIESGNHEELMAKGGFYADLYNSQFAEN